jgi:hypothetical protein
MNIMGAVYEAAEEQNGWTVIAYAVNRRTSGTRRNGVVAFVTDRQLVLLGETTDRQMCGTARWVDGDRGPFFITGHYDLTREEAIEDFTERVLDESRIASRV